jgi:transposase
MGWPTQPKETMTMMRFYDGQHGFYAGIDLHARRLHVCVLDASGKVVKDVNIAATPETFLSAIAPFRHDLVVGCECMFAWYWLADLCQTEKVSLLVGHAYYMRLIHGAKAKNDKIDAHKIARLLRGGNFPLSYSYPKGMRETRDLLRRRTFLVRQRSGLITHLQILNAQYNLPPFAKKLANAGNRLELDIAARFTDPSVQKSAAADLAVIDCLDEQIAALELYLTRTAKVDDVQTYHRLRTIPGVGPVLALILLYEIHDIKRFASAGQFLSYARLVRCAHESDGKVVGSGGQKIGNAHLRWAFGEAACLFLRSSERAKKWKAKQEKKRGEGKVLAVLAARLARTVYHLWRKAEAFDEDRFWGGRNKEEQTGSSSLGRAQEASHAAG